MYLLTHGICLQILNSLQFHIHMEYLFFLTNFSNFIISGNLDYLFISSIAIINLLETLMVFLLSSLKY